MTFSPTCVFGRLRSLAVFVLAGWIGVAAVAFGEGVDLSERDLSHSNYHGRDLRGANLKRSELTMADFSGTDLRGADFTGTKLDRINLDNADLRDVIGWAKADLGLGIKANGANFAGTDLHGGFLIGGYSGGYFEGATFAKANLAGATLHGRFHGATFDGAIVTDALMIGADGIDSLHQDLSQRGAIVTKADVAKAVRSERDFSNAQLSGAQLQDTDLSGARLFNANLHSANLANARLHRADLREAAFYWADTTKTQFDGADLSRAKFDNMKSRGASFVGCKLIGTSLKGANLNGANLSDADLTGADFSYADLTNADLTGAILKDISIEAAILNNVRGLEPTKLSELTKRSGRWEYDLRNGFNRFVSTCSLPLHLLFTPLAVALGLLGSHAERARRSFLTLTAINGMAAIPFAASLLLALLGGSPTAQMSAPGLWMLWFQLWGLMVFGLGVLLAVSIAAATYHVVRHVLMKPRTEPLVSLCCAVLTLANCAFAFSLLVLMAPDA